MSISPSTRGGKLEIQNLTDDRAKQKKLTASYINRVIRSAAYRARNTALVYARAPVDPHGKLNLHHGPRSLLGMEGYMRPGQAKWMQALLLEETSITRIAEIGFNEGHSSFTFLHTRPDISVLSFDLGDHSYVPKAAAFIKNEFPGRHSLILGDSQQTVPDYSLRNPGDRFDLLFIDGGHQFKNAREDIQNMRGLAARNHVVIVDDYMPNVKWGAGPAAAWDEAVRSGEIMQEAIVSADNRTRGSRQVHWVVF